MSTAGKKVKRVLTPQEAVASLGDSVFLAGQAKMDLLRIMELEDGTFVAAYPPEGGWKTNEG